MERGGGRRARAARQEAQSRRLVTARLGAHGCAREPGGQASAPLRRAPGGSAPRRGCPRPHPCARPARLDELSGARAAEIHLSVQGQDRNSASRVLRTGNFSLTRCCPSPTPGFKTKQNKNPARAVSAPSPGPPWSAPLHRLGDPRGSAPVRGAESSPSPGPQAQAAANKQARRAGWAWVPPRAPSCHPPGPWQGRAGAQGPGGSAPSRVMNLAERLCGAGGRQVSGSPEAWGRGGRAAPPTR